MNTSLRSTLALCLASACSGNSTAPAATGDKKPIPAASSSVAAEPVPKWLQHFPGLYVRNGDEIVEAPKEDIALAKTYPTWKDKGALVDGHRITIMTRTTTLKIGEEARVIHVHEIPVEGETLFPMGPKPVRGELLDGKLGSAVSLSDPNPFVPDLYDGVTMPSPGADYSWDITRYKFVAPGKHTVQWKPGKYASNILVLTVVP